MALRLAEMKLNSLRLSEMRSVSVATRRTRPANETEPPPGVPVEKEGWPPSQF